MNPILIDRVQDSEGNTIVNNYKRSCVIVIKFFTTDNYPKNKDKYKQVFSPQNCLSSNNY